MISFFKNFTGYFVSTLLLGNFFVLAASSTDNEPLNLTYVGHASVLIRNESFRLLTDPFYGNKILWGLKRKIPPAYQPKQLPDIDFILISHTHPDHYNADNILRIPGKPTVIMPWRRGRELRKHGMQVVELRPWQEFERNGLKVTAIPARHMWGNCLGYVIEVDKKKIYFTGDTKLFSEVKKLRGQGIDLVLLPYGGYPFLGSIWTTSQAVEAIKIIQPKMCIPIHWGTFERWWTKRQPENPDVFVKMINEKSPDVHCSILKVGEKTLIQ